MVTTKGNKSFRTFTKTNQIDETREIAAKSRETSNSKSILNRKRRNISVQIEDIGLARDKDNKENTPSNCLRFGEPKSSFLPQTEDKVEILITPTTTYRAVNKLLKSSDEDQDLLQSQKRDFYKSYTNGERGNSPKKLYVAQKSFTIRSPMRINENTTNNDINSRKRKAVSRLNIEDRSKKLLAKRQDSNDAAEERSSSIKKQKPMIKQNIISNLLTAIETRIDSLPTNTITASSVRNRNTKNPWSIGEVSFNSTRNGKLNLNTDQHSPIKSPKPELVSPKSFLYSTKVIKSHPRNTKKDVIATEITATTDAYSKDYLCESDRFTTFNFTRNGDEQSWINRKGDDQTKQGGYNDDIESIEENLEYEVNSNTSGICGSQAVIDYNEVKKKGDGVDSILQTQFKNETNVNVYRLATGREFGIGDSIDSLYNDKEAQREDKIQKELEQGKTRRLINQVEEKMKQMMSNSRPFSPPFVSKIIKARPMSKGKFI